MSLCVAVANVILLARILAFVALNSSLGFPMESYYSVITKPNLLETANTCS